MQNQMGVWSQLLHLRRDCHMGAVVDLLLLGEWELALLRKKYPDCILYNETDSNHYTKRYRVIIPNIDLDDNYYYFLVDHQIASTSHNFKVRVDSDAQFEKRMKNRFATTCEKFSFKNNSQEMLTQKYTG
jgi:hypothetical protein